MGDIAVVHAYGSILTDIADCVYWVADPAIEPPTVTRRVGGVGRIPEVVIATVIVGNVTLTNPVHSQGRMLPYPVANLYLLIELVNLLAIVIIGLHESLGQCTYATWGMNIVGNACRACRRKLQGGVIADRPGLLQGDVNGTG